MKIKEKEKYSDEYGRIIALKGSDKFIEIWDKSKNFYGGNQNWFSNIIQRKGACGTVAAANMTAYIAFNNKEYSNLYQYENFNKENFLEHMIDMNKYLYPLQVPYTDIPLGIWSTRRLKKGVEEFAKNRGVPIRGVEFNDRFNKNNIIEFIKNALKENLPVAMLIGFNSNLKNIKVIQPNGCNWNQLEFKLHWVVITELLINNSIDKVLVKVSTWGGYSYLDLDLIVGGKFNRKKLIYFE